MKYKFHIVPASHPDLRYQHEMVCLAEGFREIGCEFYGTDDYWIDPTNNNYLVRRAPNSFDSDVNIFNVYYFKAFPEAIDAIDYSKINVLIDREDGLYGDYCNPRYKKFNLILRTHYNGNINYNHYHSNIQPWAFGLSNRIMEAIDRTRNCSVQDKVFVSFRLSHDLRSTAVERFSPVISKKYGLLKNITNDIATLNPDTFSEVDRLYWKQSGHRHDPEYYKLLNSSLLTFAFGGFTYLKPFAANRVIKQLQKVNRLIAALRRNFNMDDSKCYFIDQFDSWRLWESFYSNTCPIHMDFVDWKWILPVMPENKIHYWGVKRFDFEKSAVELLDMNINDIQQMGYNGIQWSMKNYSSVAVAERFIRIVESL